MAKQKRQVGGRKETPLAGVGCSGLGSGEQHDQIFTPEDAEYQLYSELLKGFFEKFTRWKDILAADECQENEKIRGFSVIRSANGLSVKPGNSWVGDDPPDKILQVRNITELNDPEHGCYQEKFIIRPGQLARKHLLIDPDGKPLEEVRITVGIQSPIQLKKIEIQTERFRDKPGGHFNYREADYRLIGDTLVVLGYYDVMTDDMAISLINTIDALIPGSQPLTLQNERRTTAEIQIAKALPPARRTRPRTIK